MAHRHEWYFKTDYGRSKPLVLTLIQGWECRTCGEMLPLGEDERRVNAVEALSAEDADKAASFMTQWAWIQTAIPHDEERIDALCAYAKILEGKDE